MFAALTQLYSLEPNFNLEVVEHFPTPLDPKNTELDGYRWFSFKCVGTEKNIDTKLIVEGRNGKKTTTKTFIDSEGNLKLRDYPLREFASAFDNVYGECVILHVESRDYSVDTKEPVFYSKLRFVPYPIIETNDVGVCLSCETLDTQGKNFSISLNHLQPNEEVNFDSVTSNKTHSFKLKSDSNGELKFIYSAEILANNKNPFRVTASNDRIGSLSIRHYAGMTAFMPLKKYVKPDI